MNKNYEKKTAHSQTILHGNIYNIKRQKYKTVCAELVWVKVTFDRIVMIFLIEFVFLFLFICYTVGLLQYSECMITGRNSNCLYDYKLYINYSTLYQKLEKLSNVCHIYNVFKFICTFLHCQIK